VWVDDRHVGAASPDGDGVVVLDADSMRETGRLLEGRRVRPVSEEQGWWVQGQPAREVFQIEDGRVVHQHALSRAGRADEEFVHVGTRVAPDGAMIDAYRAADPTQAIVHVDGEEAARIALASATERIWLSERGRWLVGLDAAVGVLRAFDARTGASAGEVSGLRVSTCPRVLYLPGEREVLTYDAELRLVAVDLERMEIRRLDEDIVGDSCSGGDVSDDGTLYAHAPYRRPLEVHELATGRLLLSRPVGLLPDGGHDAWFSPDGRRVIVTATDRGACVLDLDLGPDLEPGLEPAAADALRDAPDEAGDPRVTTFRGHGSFVYDVATAPDPRNGADCTMWAISAVPRAMRPRRA
jgi:hypothetical protein